MDSNKIVAEQFKHLKSAKFQDYIPVIVFVFCIMIIGFIGNVLACVHYGGWSGHTPAKRLIFTLAVIDTIMCVLMATDFVDLSYVYAMESLVYCKTVSFLKHLTGLLSICILIAIVVFRYQAVCKPFGTRLNIRHCNMVISLSCIFALIETMPTVFIYDSIYVNVTITDNITVQGRDCGISKGIEMRLLNTVINAIDGVIVIGGVMTLIILYAFIARYILVHRKSLEEIGMRINTVKSIRAHMNTLKTTSLRKSTVNNTINTNEIDHTQNVIIRDKPEEIKGDTTNGGQRNNEVAKSTDRTPIDIASDDESVTREVDEDTNTNAVVGDGDLRPTGLNDGIDIIMPGGSGVSIATELTRDTDTPGPVREDLSNKNIPLSGVERHTAEFGSDLLPNTNMLATGTNTAASGTECLSNRGRLAEETNTTLLENRDETVVNEGSRSAVDKDLTIQSAQIAVRTTSDDTARYTMMTFVVTLAFVFSFIPYIVVSLRDNLGDVDVDADRVLWVRFAKRSYLINSVTNPIIYGYYNPAFRAFVRDIITRRLNPFDGRK